MTRPIRKLAILLGVASAATLLTPPATVSASGLEISCTPSSNAVSFTPALTLTPQSVTVVASTQYSTCISPTQPAVTSGTRGSTIVMTRSCLDLLSPANQTYTISWNTGQSSTISGTVSTSTVGAVVIYTVTGTVTSGLFAGSSVVQVNVAPSADILLCTLGLGTVSSLNSAVTLTISS